MNKTTDKSFVRFPIAQISTIRNENCREQAFQKKTLFFKQKTFSNFLLIKRCADRFEGWRNSINFTTKFFPQSIITCNSVERRWNTGKCTKIFRRIEMPHDRKENFVGQMIHSENEQEIVKSFPFENVVHRNIEKKKRGEVSKFRTVWWRKM